MAVSRETFKGSDNPTQNLILFESIKALDEKIVKRHTAHDKAHVKLDKDIERSGKVNRRTSAASGLLGGFLAVVASKIFGL